MIREPASQNSLGCSSLRVPSRQTRFQNIVPANIVKTKKTFYLPVILTDRHRAAPHILCLRYAHTHRLWTHAATAPAPICRACTRICVAVRWTPSAPASWPSLCTMHAPLPCNCRCLISGSSRRLPSPGMRRRALHTCIRKHVPGPHPILARRLRAHLVLACQRFCRFHGRLWLCSWLALPLWGVQE